MRELLYFDSMITPKLITLIYWVLLGVIALSGLGYLSAGYGNFVVKLFTAAIAVSVGALLVRVWCELLIVLFKIHENIASLASRNTPAE